MPCLYSYKCNKCNFSMADWTSGYIYVTNEDGRRILCPHPGELSTIFSIIEADKDDFGDRVGFNSYAVCLECHTTFALDLKESIPYIYFFMPEVQLKKYKERPLDRRICPNCDSINIKTVLEMVGNECPECHEGIVVKDFLGLIT